MSDPEPMTDAEIAERWPETVERMALALFDANPTRNPALSWKHAATPKLRYRKSAIAIIRSELAAGMLVGCPAELTEEMGVAALPRGGIVIRMVFAEQFALATASYRAPENDDVL